MSQYYYAARTKRGWSQILHHKCALSTGMCGVYHHDMDSQPREDTEDEVVRNFLGSFTEASNMAALSNLYHWSFRPWLFAKPAEPPTI